MNERITDRIPGAVSITSRTNATVTALAKLSQAKHRREQNLFLAEGYKLSEEAASRPQVRYVLLRSDDGMADASLIALAASAPADARVLVLPSTVFEKITTESAPQGIITVLSPFADMHRDLDAGFLAEALTDRLLAVDGVQDPGNLGTVLRTAAAFGYSHVILGHCADIYHPRTVRASMGALFRIHIGLCDNLPAALASVRSDGHRVLSAALAEHQMTLGEADLHPQDCVVIGNEGHGVSEAVLALSDGVIKIPMATGTESLNASAAAAVLMWEYYRHFS